MPNTLSLTKEDRDAFTLRRAHLKERALEEKIEEIKSRYTVWLRDNDLEAVFEKLINAQVERIASNEEAQLVFMDYISSTDKVKLNSMINILKLDLVEAPLSSVVPNANGSAQDEDEDEDEAFLVKPDPKGPMSPNAEKMKLFQEFISNMNPEQHDSFNKWLGRTDKRNAFNDWLDILPTKTELGKQREFFKWFDEKNNKLFDYYASRISAPSVKNTFQEWREGVYKSQMDEIRRKHKAGELDEQNIFQDSFNSVSEKVHECLNSLYCNLEHTDSVSFHQETAFQTGEKLYTQWVNEKCWEWQKLAFECDPEDAVNDIALLVLNAKKPEENQSDTHNSPLNTALETDRHVYTFTPDARKIDGVMMQDDPISVIYDGTAKDLTTKLYQRYGIMPLFGNKDITNTDSGLPRPHSPAVLSNVLNGNGNNGSLSPMHATNGSSSASLAANYLPFTDAKGRAPRRLSKGGLRYSFMNGEKNCFVVYDGTSKDLSQKLNEKYEIKAIFNVVSINSEISFDLPLRLEQKDHREIPLKHVIITSVNKMEGSYAVELTQRCKLFNDSQSKLLAACLAENRVALDEYQTEHRLAHLTTLSIACGGYFGEIFYVWFAYIAAVESMGMALELFGLAIEQGSILGNIMLGAGVIATAYVLAANVTFDPWADTEAAERNILLSKESMFNTLISKRFKEQPVPMTAFTIFAAGGVFPELLPAAELAKLMGTPALSYILTPALLVSGIGYYFFFNAGSVYKNTGKGWEAFAKTIHRLMDKDPEVSSIAMVEGLHKVLSFIERAWRIAYGPFYMMGVIGAGSSAAFAAAGVTFAASLIVALSTRVYPIEAFYYPEENGVITREEYQDAEQNYKMLNDKSLLEKTKLALDPTTFLAGGVGIILPLILKEAINVAGPLQMGMMVASGIASSMYLIVKFMPAARKKEINRAAHGEFELNNQTAIACMIDQGFRAFGMLFTTRAIVPSLVDPTTPTGRIGIVGLLSVELFLSFAAYLYQAEECSQAHKTMGQSIVAWWEGFMRTERGKYFVECGVSLQNIMSCCKTIEADDRDLEAGPVAVAQSRSNSPKLSGISGLMSRIGFGSKQNSGENEMSNMKERDSEYRPFDSGDSAANNV